VVRDGDMKLVLYGTGKEHPPQLFNISADPSENNDLALLPASTSLIKDLTTKLGTTLNFTAVSLVRCSSLSSNSQPPLATLNFTTVLLATMRGLGQGFAT
jgi:hypothetical protein